MEDLSEIWVSVRLTIELAGVTTVILLIAGTPLAWWLARSKTIWSEAVATIVVLPPMLPQPVLGFYLLASLGPAGPGGLLAPLWGECTLAFTFAGLVVGSVLNGLPLVVQPIRNAFITMGDRPLEVAATLRASPSYAFFKVALPLARPAFLTAAVAWLCAYDRRIRGRTDDRRQRSRAYHSTLRRSVRLYQSIALDEASWVAGGMLVFALVVILILSLIDKYLGQRST